MACCVSISELTTSVDHIHDDQGNVMRVEIMRQFWNTAEKSVASAAYIKRTHYDAERERNVRLAQVRYMDGQWMRMAFAYVPDQIEFDDIEKGAIVDFISEPVPLVNFATYQVTRILKLVCRAKDLICIHREISEGRFSKVVDADPGDVSIKYGVAYNRRNTPEDNAKYKTRR
jgi:hypothetical protein